MKISKLKLIGLALLYFVTGSIATRGSQKMAQISYESCVRDGLNNVKTMQDIFDLQDKCMPNALVMKILFW